MIFLTFVYLMSNGSLNSVHQIKAIPFLRSETEILFEF